jgi:hypothetical protein
MGKRWFEQKTFWIGAATVGSAIIMYHQGALEANQAFLTAMGGLSVICLRDAIKSEAQK